MGQESKEKENRVHIIPHTSTTYNSTWSSMLGWGGVKWPSLTFWNARSKRAPMYQAAPSCERKKSEMVVKLGTGIGKLTMRPDTTNKIPKIQAMMIITSLRASAASASSTLFCFSSFSFCSGVLDSGAACDGNKVSMNFSI